MSESKLSTCRSILTVKGEEKTDSKFLESRHPLQEGKNGRYRLLPLAGFSRFLSICLRSTPSVSTSARVWSGGGETLSFLFGTDPPAARKVNTVCWVRARATHVARAGETHTTLQPGRAPPNHPYPCLSCACRSRACVTVGTHGVL